ncbi:hypothetical protein ABK040_008895 [Willaertia magna]
MGRVMCCGLNNYSQLIDNNNNNNIPLQQIPFISDSHNNNNWFKNFKNYEKIKTISLGESHTIILTTENNLLGIGSNHYGQLGFHDFYLTLNIPTNILPHPLLFENVDNKKNKMNEIKIVKCGQNHSVLLTKRNELFVCGYNSFGQLGIFDNSFNFTTQTENAWGKNNFLQENIDTKIKTVICGTNTTFLILENHFVFACGSNTNYEIGISNNNDYVKKFELINTKNFIKDEFIIDISSGCTHSLFLTNLGNVYGCGCNTSCQLGNFYEDIIDNEGNVKELTLLKNFKDVKSVYCGMFFSVMLNNKGEVYGCGDNEDGQLTFNNNSYLTLTRLNHPQNIKNIYLGSNYIIYLTNDYKVYSNGYNEYLSLGLSNMEEEDINNYETTTNGFGEKIVINPTKVELIPFERFDIFLGNSAFGTFFVERKSKELERMKFKLKELLTKVNCYNTDILVKCKN